jgi:hypothetical protein
MKGKALLLVPSPIHKSCYEKGGHSCERFPLYINVVLKGKGLLLAPSATHKSCYGCFQLEYHLYMCGMVLGGSFIFLINVNSKHLIFSFSKNQLGPSI